MVLISMVLANDPHLLILDEPNASLDALTKADILKLFRPAMISRISLAITHDISHAAELTEKMAVLYARIVEMGRTDEILICTQTHHPYTRGLIRYYPGMNMTKDLQGNTRKMVQGLECNPFHERCTQRIEICSRKTPLLMRAIDGRLIACHHGGVIF